MRLADRKARLHYLRRLEKRNAQLFRTAVVDLVAEKHHPDRSEKIARALLYGVLNGIQDAHLAITEEIAELIPGKVIPFPGNRRRGGENVEADYDVQFFVNRVAYAEEKLKAATEAGADAETIKVLEGAVGVARDNLTQIQHERNMHPAKQTLRLGQNEV